MEIVRSAFGREARQWNAVPKKKYVRSGLDALVADFADHMRAEKQQPDRRSDIARIKEAQKSVKKALAILERVGPQALLVLPAIAPAIAPMLSARWLREQFPDDDYAPQPTTLPIMSTFPR
jgi:hypothetical protein